MHNRSCAVVVIAAGGYPGKYPQGDEINMHDRHSQIEPAGQLNFFHAGTALREDGKLVTSRGRVIAVSATADSLENAVKLAYQGVTTVKFDGMFYRRDIAHRAFQVR